MTALPLLAYLPRVRKSAVFGLLLITGYGFYLRWLWLLLCLQSADSIGGLRIYGLIFDGLRAGIPYFGLPGCWSGRATRQQGLGRLGGSCAASIPSISSILLVSVRLETFGERFLARFCAAAISYSACSWPSACEHLHPRPRSRGGWCGRGCGRRSTMSILWRGTVGRPWLRAGRSVDSVPLCDSELVGLSQARADQLHHRGSSGALGLEFARRHSSFRTVSGGASQNSGSHSHTH